MAGLLLTVVTVVALLGSSSAQLPLPLSSFQYPSAPLLPIAPIASYPNARVSSGSYISTRQQIRPAVDIEQQYISSDPCTPSPCGPNTVCEIKAGRKRVAICKCQEGFIPDGHTINGCKLQCLRDADCQANYRCTSQNRCEREICRTNTCGINAECIPGPNRPICKCPSGLSGDPYIVCSEVRVETYNPPNPCVPNPCGANAECQSDGNRAICKCLHRFDGDPLFRCNRVECVENEDCRSNELCRSNKCVNPCTLGFCGVNAECEVRNRQPVCSCRKGYEGDAFTQCREIDHCRPSPCGSNTDCTVENDRAVCRCIGNYLGDPLIGCKPECVTDNDCPGSQYGCRNDRCVNLCSEAGCGTGALCNVERGVARCSCPEHYQGNPMHRCEPECTDHIHCRRHQMCVDYKCTSHCADSCGTNAECRVDNHSPICSCPKGFTGDPFTSCRKFTIEDLCKPNPCGTYADCTPGKDRQDNDRPVCTCPRGYIGNPLTSCTRAECTDDSHCSSNLSCFEGRCQNTCFYNGKSVCGYNAECTVKNHVPTCSCPPGYTGKPLTECRVAALRYTIGRARDFYSRKLYY